MGRHYGRISSEEINETAGHDPNRAMMMVLANGVLAEAEDKATGKTQHQPTEHSAGWHIAIGTPNGVVGLWSCWLENQFYLGYPHGVTVPDQLIMDKLEVEYAKPVQQVNAWAVSGWDYAGECKDDDKPLVQNEHGQIVAYETKGMRCWAKFYGPQLPDCKGRVWIDHTEQHTHGVQFNYLDQAGRLTKLYYGHQQSMSITTYSFSFYNQYASDSPTSEKEAIQPYRNKFLELACAMAEQMGGSTGVTIDYGFVLVPEELELLGYSEIEWVQGRPEVREGWGKEVVRGIKTTDKDKEIVTLVSGNSLVPWSTVRRPPCGPKLKGEDLIDLLTF